MRRLLPTLVLLLPLQVFAGVIENASVVEAIPNVRIDNTSSGTAFGFQAVATHSAQAVWVYCAGFNSFGGNPRQYTIGLRAANGQVGRLLGRQQHADHGADRRIHSGLCREPRRVRTAGERHRLVLGRWLLHQAERC